MSRNDGVITAGPPGLGEQSAMTLAALAFAIGLQQIAERTREPRLSRGVAHRRIVRRGGDNHGTFPRREPAADRRERRRKSAHEPAPPRLPPPCHRRRMAGDGRPEDAAVLVQRRHRRARRRIGLRLRLADGAPRVPRADPRRRGRDGRGKLDLFGRVARLRHRTARRRHPVQLDRGARRLRHRHRRGGLQGVPARHGEPHRRATRGVVPRIGTGPDRHRPHLPAATDASSRGGALPPGPIARPRRSRQRSVRAPCRRRSASRRRRHRSAGSFASSPSACRGRGRGRAATKPLRADPSARSRS